MCTNSLACSGTRFISHKRWRKLDNPSDSVLPIAAGFGVIALALPGSKLWITPEHLGMFHFVAIPSASDLEVTQVLQAAVPACPDAVKHALLLTRQGLREAVADAGSALWTDEDGAAGEPRQMLSLRMVLRAARRAAAAPDGQNLMADAGSCVWHALMTDFMPRPERAAVRAVMARAGIEPEPAGQRSERAVSLIVREPDWVSKYPVASVGDIEYAVKPAQNLGLVPSTLFFDIPQHKLVLRDMMRDMKARENMLLIGNQGVGKNKITDRLLMLLQREREYIQLHRDTTVSSLLLAPSLRDGVVVYDDSPLVKAMQHGRVLVIDEFDKAPTEVVVILKGLLEDKEIQLADGRHFTREGYGRSTCQIHQDFIVVALANRPGFPFLGNSFFAEMGDCFACHTILNPDQQSEVALLSAYAPEVSVSLINILTSIFSELRDYVDKGKLSYPYSTRELVNIVKHLQRFPKDPIAEVLMNILGFDSFDEQLQQTLFEIFGRHGISLGTRNSDKQPEASMLAVPLPLPEEQLLAELQVVGNSTQELSFSVSRCSTYKCGNGGYMQWRGMNAQDMKEASAAHTTEADGLEGAEWRQLRVHSSRTARFCEEDCWWRFGFVTQENSLVKGTDPQTASWMGQMLDMKAIQSCVCILTSQMVLHVADPERRLYREIPLAVGKTLSDRAFYATGQFLVVLPHLSCLLCYDYKNEALLRISPRDGIVAATEFVAPEGSSQPVQCSGLLTGSETVVYFRVGDTQLVLACCGSANTVPVTTRAVLSLPSSDDGMLTVEVLSSHTLLIGFESGKLAELTMSSTPNTDTMEPISVTLRTVSGYPALKEVSLKLTCAKPVRSGVHVSDPSQPSNRPLAVGTPSPHTQLWSAASVYAAYSFSHVDSMDLKFRKDPILVRGYPRSCSVMDALKQAGAAGIGDPDNEHCDTVQIWHNASHSVVNTVSCGSSLATSFGIVLLEAIQVHGGIRQIVLSSTPGAGGVLYHCFTIFVSLFASHIYAASLSVSCS